MDGGGWWLQSLGWEESDRTKRLDPRRPSTPVRKRAAPLVFTVSARPSSECSAPGVPIGPVTPRRRERKVVDPLWESGQQSQDNHGP